MKTSAFDYELPNELIAKTPTPDRDKSRLLVVHTEDVADLFFESIAEFINPGDLLILNNTRVIKARLFGQKTTGGKIELLIERILDDTQFIAHVRSNKTIYTGLEVILPNNLHVVVTEKLDGIFKLKTISPIDMYAYLEEFGNIPLPPYMERSADNSDDERYQTVYAEHLGSVAAPTAGLHFTPKILEKIKARGANIAYITLHVGSGTFKPVASENIADHKMHSEHYSIPQETIDLIRETKAKDGCIIAGGTTTLRTLETIAQHDFKITSGETDIFITPGFKFRVVDKLITNFHLPKSTLLMLVSAFIGLERIKTVYQHAIDNRYRFFSYGDAMLLTYNPMTPSA